MKNKLAPLVFVIALATALFTAACQQKTGKLSPELQARFDKEGIAHRADDLTFRRTRVGDQRASGWDEKRASIFFLEEPPNIFVALQPRAAGFAFALRR
jgi:hypothetical protein